MNKCKNYVYTEECMTYEIILNSRDQLKEHYSERVSPDNKEIC